MAQPRKKNWGLQGAFCAAVSAWQIYEMAAATEAPQQAVALLQYVALGCALLGLVGALVMLGKGPPAQG
jgi:hypothetical protein